MIALKADDGERLLPPRCAAGGGPWPKMDAVRRLVSGVALRLLVTAGSNGEVALVARRVGRVRALVVLDIARAGERVAEVLERRVAVNLELAVGGRGDSGRSDTAERASERLEVLARGGSCSGRCGSSSGGRGRGGSGSSSGSSRSGRGGTRAARSDRLASVIDDGDVREVGGDPKDGVEEIGLDTGLRGASVGSSTRGLAGSLGSRISTARVREGVADELSDDVNVLGRTVVVRLQVGGLEGGLLTVVEANSEGDLRDRAATKVADAAGATASRRGGGSGGSSSGGGGSSGSVVGSRGGGGSGPSAARDHIALVVDGSDAREVRGNVEDSVEEISLDTSLGSTSVSSGARALAGRLSSRVGPAGVGEGVANELGDDVDVLRGAMVVGRQVGRLKRRLLAVVEADGECDLGDSAATEVANAAGAARDRVLVVDGAGAGDRVALIVDRDNVGEVGSDAEGSVEEVGLLAGLGSAGVGRGLSSLASGLCRSVGTARVRQGITDELGDDVNALGRTVVVRREVGRLKRSLLAVIETGSERDLRD